MEPKRAFSVIAEAKWDAQGGCPNASLAAAAWPVYPVASCLVNPLKPELPD
jgi:hypothetical protein